MARHVHAYMHDGPMYQPQQWTKTTMGRFWAGPVAVLKTELQVASLKLGPGFEAS